ncbi:hypothetical protein [Methanohalophilus sp. WG1-DM]|uniref:DUF7109 family protein n=1 Tax=Methanohalophilus sp. WG1-DM TaxID=2491675 RepID=UPI000FFF2A10|nr:hypothetical protein [Methanohalophilus sp. WG1-DM]RXG34038.1 hypothetical protein CI957_1319 [Methanohalophilus sp. WG1-DM]
MISIEELSGIIDVLGAATVHEITCTAQEITYSRDDEPPTEEDILKMCEKACSRHFLETVTCEEIIGVENTDGAEYFILGPDAFPEYPQELSDALDLLGYEKKELDMGKVATRFKRRLKMRATHLENLINEVQIPAEPEYIQELEQKYMDLVNIYYDFDTWVPDALTEIEENIFSLSARIEELKEA